MKNVTMERSGDILILKINLKERNGKSASGKTTIMAPLKEPWVWMMGLR